MPRVEANTVKGLTLALDRRKVTVPQVLEGKNFFVDIDGPRSGFSRQEIAHGGFEGPLFMQAFTTSQATATWFFTEDSIVKADILNRRWIPVLYYGAAPSANFPWTHALVGGRHYFARRGNGLIEYDPIASTWKYVDGITYGTDIPSDIVGCCEAGGRLIVIASGLVAWSPIDVGTNFTTTTATGAGFQLLSIVGSTQLDDAIGVYKTSEGFTAFTRNGTLRAQLVQGVVPFYFAPVAFTVNPINAWSIVTLYDSSLLMLTEQGFYSVKNGQYAEWDPIMSEYFRLTLLPGLKQYGNGIVKLHFTNFRGWLFVSISETLQPSVYNKAYVWSAKSNEWGQFDRLHTGIAEMYLDTGPYKGTNIGYVNTAGDGFRFSFDSLDIMFPDFQLYTYNFRGYTQYGARIEFGTYKMPTVWYTATINEKQFPAPGIYEIYAEMADVNSPSLEIISAGTVEQAATYVPAGTSIMPTDYLQGAGMIHLDLTVSDYNEEALDSYIEVGLFRFGEGQAVSEYSMMNTVMVGMLDSATIGVSYTDWLEDYSDDVFADWSTGGITFEDWGLGSAASSTYSVRLESSIDGFNPIENMDNELSLVKSDGRSQLYDAYSTGVYHTVRIEAFEIGQSFHLKALELSGELAGRII